MLKKLILTGALIMATNSHANEVKSTAYCPAVIVEAYKAVEGSFMPLTREQAAFFERFGMVDWNRHLGSTLKAKAGSAKDVNNFLRANGFANMATLTYPGTAGVFTAKLTWENPGQETSLTIKDKTYKAASFKSDSVGFLKVDGLEPPILWLPTDQPGWNVYLVAIDEFLGNSASLPTTGKQLLNLARQAHPTNAYTKAVVPAAKLETEVDVSMFLGIQKGWLTTEEARKVIRFEFDHKGASAEAAFYATTRGIVIEKEYLIKGPYLMVFAKDGMDEAAFTAYVAPDSWQIHSSDTAAAE